MKQSQRNSDYHLCQRNQLGEVAMKFGLTAEEFAEHVKDDFQSRVFSWEKCENIFLDIRGFQYRILSCTPYFVRFSVSECTKFNGMKLEISQQINTLFFYVFPKK